MTWQLASCRLRGLPARRVPPPRRSRDAGHGFRIPACPAWVTAWRYGIRRARPCSVTGGGEGYAVFSDGYTEALIFVLSKQDRQSLYDFTAPT